MGSIPGLGRSPGEGQYSGWPGEFHEYVKEYLFCLLRLRFVYKGVIEGGFILPMAQKNTAIMILHEVTNRGK